MYKSLMALASCWPDPHIQDKCSSHVVHETQYIRSLWPRTSAVCRELQSGSAFAKFWVRWLLCMRFYVYNNREPLVVSRPPDSKSEHPERLIHAALVPKLDQESICWSRQEHYDSNTLLRAVAETYPRARALALNTSKDFVFDEIGEIIHFEWRLPVVASPGFLPVAIFLPTTPLYIHPHFDGNTRCLRQRIVEALNDLLRWTRRDDTGLDRRRLKASSLMLTVHCGMTISLFTCPLPATSPNY